MWTLKCPLTTNISSFYLVRQLLAAWPFIQKGSGHYFKKARRGIKNIFRGNSRDPLLYLGIISLFLFGFVSFGGAAFLGSFSGGLSLPSQISQSPEKITDGQLFLDQERGKTSLPYYLNIVQGNSLLGTAPPIIVSARTLGSLGGSSEELASSSGNEIIEYIVESGDTISSLAEKFGISQETILWANNLSKGAKLKPGQELLILPVSGALHYVKRGENLGQIAQTYQASSEDIASFNGISEAEIFPGDILIIPEGKMPAPKKAAPQTFSQPSQIPLASSYFILPIQGKLSQGLHWYNAVDLAAPCGTPVYAAAQGQIVRTKFSNQGLGNYIAILHPNGVTTFYGHLQSILVVQSQEVSQGQMIALSGGKPGTPGAGTSTGCHLHFDVRGSTNPFAR